MKIQHETFFTTHLTSKISDSRRACLTNGFSRLRDVRDNCTVVLGHCDLITWFGDFAFYLVFFFFGI